MKKPVFVSKNIVKTFFAATALVAVAGLSAFADAVDPNGERCRRDITYDSLSAEDKKVLDRGDYILRTEEQPSGYYAGYILKVGPQDPELIFSVYARVEDHAGENGLGPFILKSELRPSPPGSPVNLIRAYYEQHVTLLGNGKYVVEDLLTKKNGTYELNGKLVEASDNSFAPRWFDGHFKAAPHPKGSFVVACHYMVPRSGMFKWKFNSTVVERLKMTADNLIRWVGRVGASKTMEANYRDTLRKRLLPENVAFVQ